MANIVKAPNTDTMKRRPSIFLAGSIDMGKAVNWQERVEQALMDFDNITVYNPRRDDWDSSWQQDITDPKFNEQVTWELDQLDLADLVVYYFDPAGPAPITLLELGLHGSTGNNAIVCCPEGYWRRGNVQMVCDRYGIKLVDNIDEFVNLIVEWAMQNNQKPISVLSCIACGYQPEEAFPGCSHNQPYKATSFTTSGHCGSTFFDSFDPGDRLEINICDECLNRAIDKNQIIRYNNANKAEIYKG